MALGAALAVLPVAELGLKASCGELNNDLNQQEEYATCHPAIFNLVDVNCVWLLRIIAALKKCEVRKRRECGRRSRAAYGRREEAARRPKAEQSAPESSPLFRNQINDFAALDLASIDEINRTDPSSG